MRELEAKPDDLCALKRTSGSTGASKLVATNHKTEVDRARKGAAINRISPGDRYAAATSIEAGMGRGATFRALLSGATLYPLDLRRENASDAARRLVRSGITHFHGTPTSLRLIAAGLLGQERDLHAVRKREARRPRLDVLRGRIEGLSLGVLLLGLSPPRGNAVEAAKSRPSNARKSR